jgi:lauroyl/myristoyl acyltransferase
MKRFWYGVVSFLSRWLGTWLAWPLVWMVAGWYFVFKPQRRRLSQDLYRAIYPERSGIQHLALAWRQYRSFTTLFVDRMKFAQGREVPCQVEGREHLDKVLSSGQGAILLMSHVGNWEMASHILGREGIRLMLFMGERQSDQIERLQKSDLELQNVKIVKVAAGGGSPMDGVAALNFLREGGLVSMSGDLQWAGERKVDASLFGRQVQFPAAPHALALVSGAPVLVFFAFRLKGGGYQVKMFPPHFVTAQERSRRDQAIRMSVKNYSSILEQVIRQHPEQWYTFEPLLGEPVQKD